MHPFVHMATKVSHGCLYLLLTAQTALGLCFVALRANRSALPGHFPSR